MEIWTALIFVCNSMTGDCAAVSSLYTFFETLAECKQGIIVYIELNVDNKSHLTVVANICHNWGINA